LRNVTLILRETKDRLFFLSRRGRGKV